MSNLDQESTARRVIYIKRDIDSSSCNPPPRGWVIGVNLIGLIACMALLVVIMSKIRNP